MHLGGGSSLNGKQVKSLFKKLRQLASGCRKLSFIFKTVSRFALKHSKYIKERKVRRIIIGLVVCFKYFGDFIDFLCWSVVPATEIQRVIGDKDAIIFNSTLAIRYVIVLKIVLEDWWFSEYNWVFYDDVLDYINKYTFWHGDVFNFIFFS